jgi:hypothetical protein
MHPAKLFEMERLAREFAAWRAVAPDQRAPAAAWWWGTALGLRDEREPAPNEICVTFELARGATFADASARLIAALAGQTDLARPDGFPYRLKPLQRESGEIPPAFTAE